MPPSLPIGTPGTTEYQNLSSRERLRQDYNRLFGVIENVPPFFAPHPDRRYAIIIHEYQGEVSRTFHGERFYKHRFIIEDAVHTGLMATWDCSRGAFRILASLLLESGHDSNQVFTVRRRGLGLETRYDIERMLQAGPNRTPNLDGYSPINLYPTRTERPDDRNTTGNSNEVSPSQLAGLCRPDEIPSSPTTTGNGDVEEHHSRRSSECSGFAILDLIRVNTGYSEIFEALWRPPPYTRPGDDRPVTETPDPVPNPPGNSLEDEFFSRNG